MTTMIQNSLPSSSDPEQGALVTDGPGATSEPTGTKQGASILSFDDFNAPLATPAHRLLGPR